MGQRCGNTALLAVLRDFNHVRHNPLANWSLDSVLELPQR